MKDFLIFFATIPDFFRKNYFDIAYCICKRETIHIITCLEFPRVPLRVISGGVIQLRYFVPFVVAGYQRQSATSRLQQRPLCGKIRGGVPFLFFSQHTLLRRSAIALPRIFSMSSAKNALSLSKKPFLTVTFCSSLSETTFPSLSITSA